MLYRASRGEERSENRASVSCGEMKPRSSDTLGARLFRRNTLHPRIDMHSSWFMSGVIAAR